MDRLIQIAAVLILLTGGAAAQQEQQPEETPGQGMQHQQGQGQMQGMHGQGQMQGMGMQGMGMQGMGMQGMGDHMQMMRQHMQDMHARMHEGDRRHDRMSGMHHRGGKDGHGHKRRSDDAKRDDIQSRLSLPGGQRLLVLKPDVARGLDILRIPSSDPVPLLIGTYWNCTEVEGGHETCDLRIVVCNDDQSFCTEIP